MSKELRAQILEIEERIKVEFQRLKYFNTLRLQHITTLLEGENFEATGESITVNQTTLAPFTDLSEIEAALNPVTKEAIAKTGHGTKFGGREYKTRE